MARPVKILTAIMLLITTCVFGQKTGKANTVAGLTTPALVIGNDIAGNIYKGDGYVHSSLKLDSTSNKFRILFSTCLGRSIVARGTWNIENNNTLVLTTAEEKKQYDIIKFENFYFFILPEEKDEFLTAVADVNYKTLHPVDFEADNSPVSKAALIKHYLISKFFSKQM